VGKPRPDYDAGPMDRRVPVFVLLYGALVAGGGIVGYVVKGSLASLVSGGSIGLLLLASGAGMLRGSAFSARAAQWLTLATVAVMAERLIRTGGVVPAVPVMAAGLGLSYVLYMDKALRDGDAGPRVPPPPPAP